MRYFIKLTVSNEEAYFKGIDDKNIFIGFGVGEALLVDKKQDAIHLVTMLANILRIRKLRGYSSIVVKSLKMGKEHTEYTRTIVEKGERG